MATIYRDEDVDLSVLRTRRVGVIGYGNQGRAQALAVVGDIAGQFAWQGGCFCLVHVTRHVEQRPP